MHPQIQSVLDDLAAARARWAALSAATDDAHWARRRDPESWSVAECVAHLNLTARAMQPLLDGASEQARLRGATAGRMKQSLFGKILGVMVGPVPRLLGRPFGRVKTPAPFVPTGDAPRAAIVAEFERHLAAHEAGLRAADGLPLHEVQVESPFVPGTRYDAYSGWVVLVRHLHRHLDQAERVWGAR